MLLIHQVYLAYLGRQCRKPKTVQWIQQIWQKKDDNTPTEAVFFHDSIHKYLDPSKLSKDTNVHLTMRETYTLSELYNNVKELKGGELFLSHVGVNDLKQGKTVDDCVKKYTNLLEDITIKGHKCIIPLLTPTKDLTANSNKGPNT